MLKLTRIRELSLRAPSRPGRPSHLSAASGIVVRGDYMYVVADDEHYLGVFPAKGSQPGYWLRILDGDLPNDKDKRKRRKPDLESLLPLPPFPRFRHGALLAIGSGSRPNRRRAVLLALDAAGAVRGKARVIDLSPLMIALERHLDVVNIEGATLSGEHWILLQRGNKGTAVNAVVTLRKADLLRALARGDVVPEIPFDVRTYDLGSIDNIPLCFTDGVALGDGRIVFTCVAEDTDDPYADGPCAGAGVGILDATGHLQRLQRLPRHVKAEGIAATQRGNRIELLLVTDADDARVPAWLYAARWEHSESRALRKRQRTAILNGVAGGARRHETRE